MVLAIGLGWLASRRNDVYRNPIALWKDSVLKCPENTFARDNLGALLAQSGDLAGAAAQFSAVVGLKPDDFYGHLNWGTVLLQSGKPADAAIQFREAIRIDPSQPVPHQLLEEALKRAGH
jgi:predicted Zn-dependent protease